MDPNLRDVARQKVVTRKVSTSQQQQPKYRDRASERRVLFNQPETPLPEKDNKVFGKKRNSEGPPSPPLPPHPIDLGKDESNVGNKLLKLMGWKEGQGLGTEGEGRVEPMCVSCSSHERRLIVIKSHTAIYAQGVGLGASKGKEIGKYAEGYSGYVHMAQDAVSDCLHRGRGNTTWLQNGTERIICRRVNDMEARIALSRFRPVILSLHAMSFPRLITHQDSMYSYKLHYNIKYTCFALLSSSFTRLMGFFSVTSVVVSVQPMVSIT